MLISTISQFTAEFSKTHTPAVILVEFFKDSKNFPFLNGRSYDSNQLAEFIDIEISPFVSIKIGEDILKSELVSLYDFLQVYYNLSSSVIQITEIITAKDPLKLF